MAVLKIPQSELRANVGQATPVSEGALPLTIAKAYGQAIGEVGKQVQKVAKEQKDINFYHSLQAMQQTSRSRNSNNSDTTISTI